MYKFLTGIIFFLSFSSFSQVNDSSFTKLVEKAKMNFINNSDLMEIPLDTNNKIKYDYAQKYADRNFYVLYSISPSSPDLNQVQYVSKDENGNLLDQHIARFVQIVFDIHADEYFDYKVFDSLAVKQEFNADWGASSTFTLKPKSFQGLKYCTAVSLHKENAADVIIFFISDSKENFNANLTPLFYNLQFKL